MRGAQARNPDREDLVVPEWAGDEQPQSGGDRRPQEKDQAGLPPREVLCFPLDALS